MRRVANWLFGLLQEIEILFEYFKVIVDLNHNYQHKKWDRQVNEKNDQNKK
jgi:hypothetical protein